MCFTSSPVQISPNPAPNLGRKCPEDNPQGRGVSGPKSHLQFLRDAKCPGRKGNTRESLGPSGYLGGKDPTRESKRRKPKLNCFYSPK